MKEEQTYHSPAPKYYIVSAIVLVIVFWILETALEVYIFHLNKNFIHKLLFPSLHELWMRLIVASLTVLAVVLAYYLSRHRKMEHSLRENEDKFHSLFNQASDSIFLFRLTEDDLIIEDVNAVACSMHGYTREELIGQSIGMLDDPETRKHIQDRIALLMSGNPLHVEAVHVRKDGSPFPIEIAAQRIHIGEKPYILAIDRDISMRKKTESALSERMILAELSADMGLAFTTAISLQDALQKCSRSLVDHLDALFARVWLFNEKENILELKASAGLYTHLDGPHSRIKYGQYKIGIIAKNRTPHLTNHVTGDPQVSDQEWARKEKIVSFAGHPLMLQNRLIGVMAMFSRNVLSETTMKALSAVADQVAIGIDHKLKEEQVLHAKEKWETTFDTIPDIVIVIDRNYRIMRANNTLAKRLRIDRDSIIGQTCYRVVHGTSEPPSFCPHLAVLADGKERVEEIFDEHLNGHFQFSATPILDSQRNVIATVHVARDITKRKMMEERLKEAAITDELTGLLNRRGFYTVAEQQCRFADRTKRGISLLYIDLDGMKTINDELGHQAGDQALIDMAAILKKTFRGSDVIARMGGDEFSVLLTEPSESVESAVTQHLHDNISKHNKTAGRTYELLVSLGISYYDPLHPCSIENLLMKADSLMYEDKKSHKEPDYHFVKNNPGQA